MSSEPVHFDSLTMHPFGPSFFESARDKKLSDRQSALDAASEALSKIPIHPEEERILDTPACELADKIKSNKYLALTVVAAFARQCIATHNETNCLTESCPHYY